MRGEQGWRGSESARLPPMCPWVDSRTRCHMWIEFVVGSRPCSEGFSPGSPVFFPPRKPTFLNSNSIGNSRATGLSVEDCCESPSLNKVDLLLLLLLLLLLILLIYYRRKSSKYVVVKRHTAERRKFNRFSKILRYMYVQIILSSKTVKFSWVKNFVQ